MLPSDPAHHTDRRAMPDSQGTEQGPHSPDAHKNSSGGSTLLADGLTEGDVDKLGGGMGGRDQELEAERDKEKLMLLEGLGA